MDGNIFQLIWFLLVAVLFTGFLFLEGFDYGVGMLVPFAGKDDKERRIVINSIGPFWDGNEVWLLTAGGAIFAAFPLWYSTLFSKFYLALFLILVGLILRGVAFEFHSKSKNPKWRTCWDWAFSIGSFLPALLWGVAVANLIRGVVLPTAEPLGQWSAATQWGFFFSLLHPFCLLGGVVTFLLFLYHGACFLTLKVGDETVLARAKKIALRTGIILIPVTVLWVVYALFQTTILFSPNEAGEIALQPKWLAIITVALAAVALLVSVFAQWKQKFGLAFVSVALMIVFVTATVFAIMFPNVLIFRNIPAASLNIYNASSSLYTLKIMTIVAAIFTPIVLLYQIWNFWVFKKRVTNDPKDLVY
ncbi:MAG: cytochrome d ubiquinol oxidase subunit II [Treponema sp.]|jgi:cytochrome d ubiquinol oxidase subunit II|nr:cytochrome d ubiquinol oxidase subunit II [Treponema sp.]